MAQGPLTETDYRGINTGLGMVSQRREELQKLSDAGVDVSEPLAVLDALQYQLTQLKKSFFPDRQ